MRRRPTPVPVTAAALLAAAPVVLPAQSAGQSAGQSAVSYERAEQLLPWHAGRRLSGDSVAPQWLKDGNRFWYRAKTRTGAEYRLVAPARNDQRPLYDHARLAAAITAAADTAVDGEKLPFRTLTFTRHGDDEGRIEFRLGKRRVECDLAAYACTAGDTTYAKTPFVLSPDKQWEAFVVTYDVYVRKAGGGDSVRLTTDGVQYWSYGLTELRPMQAFRPVPRRPQITWAPDSRRLLVQRQDERGVALMPYVSMTSQRPRLFTQPYALPGDTAIPKPGAHVLDREARTNVRIELPWPVAQLTLGGSAADSAWSPDGRTLALSALARGSKAAYLFSVDAATGKATLVARDTGKTFVEIGPPTDPQSWHVTADGQDVFWWSERDGWGHLYRLGPTGAVKNRLTEGPWQVGRILHVDATLRQVWFTGRGREKGDVPYYARAYRVNFDGSGLTLLTPEDVHHDVVMSPSGKWMVDRMSRIERAPTAVLREAATGRILRRLDSADVSRLAEVGWRAARPVTLKARDGITDVHGVLYLPAHLDTTKRYPILDHIYPGPQVGSVGPWSFKGGSEPAALAELGFVVLQLDHLGTPMRSKAFHDNYYADFGDNGIADHVAAIKQLGAKHRWIDLDRVGIFGHSGGGFASTGAMLRFPDFYKVAVSGAGNHDNRSYNIYWAEKYQGLLVRDSLRKTDNFAEEANATHAEKLQGKLLLMHGDMDDNVHPAMTIQVVDALIKANKSFDLVIAPNRAHSLNEPYFIRRRWDYFVEHLMGAVPPVNYRITRPEGEGSGEGGPDDP
ncbi:MAG: DPP IV N-terminal domain-containing protein [Gemmatimonadota bacterium]